MGRHTLHIIICICWVLTTPLITGEQIASSPNVIAPHCSDKCGNVTIPYPFGIEPGCYFEVHDTNSTAFKINCSHISNPPKPIVSKNVEVVEISISEGELRSKMKVSYICYNKSGGVTYSWQNSIRLKTFTLSSTKNVLVALGCDTSAWFSGRRSGKMYSMGCMSTCMEPGDLVQGDCTGTGCCQASIPEGVQGLIMNARSVQNHVLVNDFNPCSVAFPVAKDAFTFDPSFLDHDAAYYNVTKRPIVFNWAIGRKNCSEAQRDDKSFLCKQNAECYELKHQVGYRCRCKQGFSGNPYLPQGCNDVNECKEGHSCQKQEYCINTYGGYLCKCPLGHHGNGTLADPCISNAHPWLIPVFTSTGVGGGIVALLVFAVLLHWKHGEEKLKKMRENLFRENGGLLLHEKLSGRNVDMLKIFTTKDLEMATDNYSERNIIGRGGFGIVHKGILPNNQLVAIKRSLKVNLDQVEQFINEILVLSQINNKNVVKLIGCCLESEVPLLVYEFINNGTLYDHLHDSVRASNLKWPLRLRIASEVANVLSYLHNTISTPIIHRDVKSLNILLDANYTAKVIDFGASRLVPSDKNQFSTMVLGTRGYLDPEYLQTSELTSKSDVYSFGVVLLELLTALDAFSIYRLEKEKCLAMHFLLKIKDDRLMDIIDKNILDTRTNENEQIQQVANLAKWCLMLKGEDRPTMKEVAIDLEHIISKGAHPWSDNNLSLEEDCQTLLEETLVSSYSDGGYKNSTINSSLYDALSSLGRGR